MHVKNMTRTRGAKRALSMIDGRYLSSGEVLPVLNKFSGEVIGEVHQAQEEAVRLALDTAAAAKLDRSLSPEDRAEILHRAAQILHSRSEEFSERMVEETGFSYADCAGEIDRSVKTLQISAEEAVRISGESVPLRSSESSETRRAFTVREPRGVVVAVTPFNSPVNVVLHKVAPAIAAGNVVILKPSERTPLITTAVCEVLFEAGLPHDRLSVLHGSGRAIFPLLGTDSRVDFFAFTGSTEVGKVIQEAAMLRPTQMELGSISQLVVTPSADVDDAADKIMKTAFRKAGQVCTSPQIIWVADEVYDAFSRALKKRVSGLVAGNPSDRRVNVGPVISPEDAQRINGVVEDLIDRGVEIYALGDSEGSLVYPTIAFDPPDESLLVTKEVFGPVVGLRPYSDIELVLRSINSSDFGLSVGLFTDSLQDQNTFIARIQAGTLNINNSSSARADEMPFGGVKQSGHGFEGPRFAIREMTRERLITID